MSRLFAFLFGGRREFHQVHVESKIFEFEFARRPDGRIRIYIEGQPSYGTRSDDLQSTHRYFEGGRYFVCIQDHLAPRDFAEARGWANYFAIQTSRYIQTGQHFS